MGGDVIESMATSRRYRHALGLGEALAEIENNAGRLYDADVASAALRLFRDKEYQLPQAA
jgi:HD-GYP domain-containing protein (c-di-GMP phosphodiesterase class II)